MHNGKKHPKLLGCHGLSHLMIGPCVGAYHFLVRRAPWLAGRLPPLAFLILRLFLAMDQSFHWSATRGAEEQYILQNRLNKTEAPKGL